MVADETHNRVVHRDVLDCDSLAIIYQPSAHQFDPEDQQLATRKYVLSAGTLVEAVLAQFVSLHYDVLCRFLTLVQYLS